MHILILENEPLIAAQIETFALACGYTVEATVGTAEEALRISSNATIDLLIADIDLGEGTQGTDVALELYERTGTKTVFITGRRDPEARDRAQQAWPLAYLVKPFDFDIFRSAMRSIENLINMQKGTPSSFGR